MRGFAILAAAYAGLWGLLLAPGAVVMVRRRPEVAVPDDDLSDMAWLDVLGRRLRRRATRTVVPTQVPLTERPPERGRRREPVARAVVRVKGSVRLPDGAACAVGLLVEGDVDCGKGSVLLGPVWATGRVRMLDGAWALSHVVAERSLRLGAGVRVDGGVGAVRDVVLGPDAVVAGPAASRSAVVLAPRSRVGSALAPVVRGSPPPPDGAAPPRPDVRPLEPRVWTSEMDDVLREGWAEAGPTDLVTRVRERTGVAVRGVDVMRRARELRLFERGLPRRPAVLGRKPAWVLSPELVRVGADLQVPAGTAVAYGLVVEGALEVCGGAELEAPARAGRGIVLRTGAVAYAQLASDGLVVCEEGTAVLGPVDSSTHILVLANGRVGLPGFGGAHALGAIGLEPGAEIVGGAVAGLGVRGQPLGLPPHFS